MTVLRESADLTVRAGPTLAGGYLAATIAEAATPVMIAWLTKTVIDRLFGGGSGPAVTVGATALAAVGLAAAVLPRVTGYLRDELGRRVSVRALDRLFAATQRLVGLRRFEEPAYLDRLRLAQQSTSMAGQLLEAVVGLGRGAVTLVGFVATLLVISPLMTGLVLVAAVPALVAEVSLSRRRARMIFRLQAHHRREFFYSQLLGGVGAAKEIRLFGLGGFLRGRLLDERGATNAAMRRVDARELVVQGLLAADGAVLAGGGLIVVVLAARRGALTPGDVAMFVAAVAGVQSAVDGIVHGTAQAHQHLAEFAHYVAVIEDGPDLPVPARPRTLPALRHGIQLRDVWFRYGDDHPWILRGVDLVIPYGRSVALVGLNGAGKSTLVKLLCRLYDPTRGSITWDGVDLRDVDPAHLRNRISAVFQDHMNYDLSAAENIAVGDLTALADRTRLQAAAARAGVDATIAALPRGYDTPLTRMFDAEDAGVVLSGGQWQRIALARAFVRDGRELMILDEPSSGLDPQAEHELHAAMRSHREGATSLLISHRLNAVRDADLIAVLDCGRIAESGDHVSLLAAGGGYARLFALQAEGYVLS